MSSSLLKIHPSIQPDCNCVFHNCISLTVCIHPDGLIHPSHSPSLLFLADDPLAYNRNSSSSWKLDLDFVLLHFVITITLVLKGYSVLAM